MRKLHIKKQLRQGLMLISIILIAIISYYIYNTITSPGTTEETKTLYNYTAKPNVSYKVFLKPNILYEKETLGEDHTYISGFTDSIESTFNYQLKGNRQAEISGDHEVIAKVQGYVKKGETENVIWEKKFEILPKETFKTKGESISLNKTVSFRFDKFEDFARQVIKDSKAVTKNRLILYQNINLKGVTDKGDIEENISPSLIMPLGENYFNITKENLEEKTGSIDTTEVISLPVNRKVVTSYGVLLGFLIIALVLLIFFTVQSDKEDKFEKELNKIFKKYGNRLVAMDSYKEEYYKNFTQVKTMDDLVRVADEIQRPITYKYSNDISEITEFYTHDETWMYIFDLRNYVNQMEKGNKKDDGEYAEQS